jgi:hypothetical protein
VSAGVRSLVLLGVLSTALSCADGKGPSSQSTQSGNPAGTQSGCNPYACDCGMGEQSSGGDSTPATCVGTPLCNDTSECPAARSGSIEPICRSNGDLILNGYSGKCVLPCDTTTTCPDDMQCISETCRFLAD